MPTLSLSEPQIESFNNDGYLIAENVLHRSPDIDAIEDEYSEILDRETKRLYEEGRLSTLYADLPFLERFTKILGEGVLSFQPFDIALHPGFDENAHMHLGPEVFHRVLRNPHILDIVESLIGTEIFSNPVQHARIKPPEGNLPGSMKDNNLVGATGWHQDLGVIDAEADTTDLISVWVAVTDATEENGCLLVVPGSHRKSLVPHCPAGGKDSNPRLLSIRETHIDRDAVVPLPVAAGSAIIFTKQLIHASLPNLSNTIRWSFDLRYNPIGQPSGRSWFPGFVARSRAHPESELTDVAEWAGLWREAHAQMVREGTSGRPFTRWMMDEPGCA